jgi:hypothetical protein
MIVQRIFPRLLLTHIVEVIRVTPLSAGSMSVSPPAVTACVSGTRMVVIGVKFVSTVVDWGDQFLVPNIGEEARAKDDVKEF